MKMTLAKSCLVAVTAGLLSMSVAVVAQDKAATLDELLDMVKNSQISQTADSKKREVQFGRSKSNQASLLAQAKNTLVSEERRAATLEAKYDEQKVEVDAKRIQFNESIGSLGELFGHLTSTAGDLRATIDDSLISAQFPGRGEFLDELIDKMNSNTRLPSIEEIERLWSALNEQMVESGRVVIFSGEVIKPNGDVDVQDVVRIGSYNLVSDGKYLNYIPDGNKMEELTRQPLSLFTSSALELQGASTGLIAVGIDPTGPTGGNLLKALIDTPNMLERWHQGGGVGYVITAVGLFGALIGLWRLLYLFGVSSKVNSQLKRSKANPNNPLGRVLKVAQDNPNADVETLELKLEEAILKERPAIESGLSILKIIAAIAPLMGLLGTVVGMILTFQAITIFGAGDPKNMAGGISSALITTVLGLVVAIPIVLIHTVVNGRAKRIIHILEEQSAGIVAENAERRSK